MALSTLRQMALGGLYDQLGGGFRRYSTDEQWMPPHFEKMLWVGNYLSNLAPHRPQYIAAGSGSM